MKFTKHLKLEALIFFVIGATVGFVALQTQNNNPVTITSSAAAPTPTTTTAFVSSETETSQISSDGTKKVLVRKTVNKDGTYTYEVSIEDEAMDTEGPVIFAKILDPEEYLSIPFNTWSANNTYFFLEEHTKTGTKILVFQANGKPFADGEVSIDVTNLFANSPRRATTDTFAEATGWAESNLLIINTKLSDGAQGSSYWFEVPSKVIYRLSTKF